MTMVYCHLGGPAVLKPITVGLVSESQPWCDKTRSFASCRHQQFAMMEGAIFYLSKKTRSALGLSPIHRNCRFQKLMIDN